MSYVVYSSAISLEIFKHKHNIIHFPKISSALTVSLVWQIHFFCFIDMGCQGLILMVFIHYQKSLKSLDLHQYSPTSTTDFHWVQSSVQDCHLVHLLRELVDIAMNSLTRASLQQRQVKTQWLVEVVHIRGETMT